MNARIRCARCRQSKPGPGVFVHTEDDGYRVCEECAKRPSERVKRARGAWTDHDYRDAQTAVSPAVMPERLRQGITDIIDGYVNTDDAVMAAHLIRESWTRSGE